MDAPTTHTFTVTVTCATADQATQVLSERLDHDEDYGFMYALTWDAHHSPTGREETQ